jgi:Domain of unknown function (DUF6894)
VLTAAHYGASMRPRLRGCRLPRYTFRISEDYGSVEDDAGVSLPNAETAYHYACDVVRELMRCRELRTRHWHLHVYEENEKQIFEIPFASLDQTPDHLTPDLREVVEHNARRIRSLKDALYDATVTVREAKSLVARSHGKPYLAVDRGRKVIRDDS